MVTPRHQAHKPKQQTSFNAQVIKGLLMLQGHTIESFAAKHRVSRPLVSRIIKGGRPALSGKSAIIRRKLAALAATAAHAS